MKLNFKKICSYIAGIIYCLLIFVAIIITTSLLPIKNNFKIYSVMSGSMEPAISTGSLIVVKSQNNYALKDVITFQSDEQLASKNTTTHRIVSSRDQNGIEYYTTKGDANDSNDPEQIAKYRVIGKVKFSVPLFGYLISYTKTLPGLMLLIIIPAVIIIYEEIRKIHREAKIIIKRRKKNNGLRLKNTAGLTENNKSENNKSDQAKLVEEEQ